jgi:hypothetical protein
MRSELSQSCFQRGRAIQNPPASLSQTVLFFEKYKMNGQLANVTSY